MEADLSQLRALSAVVAGGTFEAAARALHITPSAVSQRIKALETSAGRVLLVRSKPVRVTSSGEAVLRLARQVEFLAADATHELGAEAEPTDAADARPMRLPIAINADSLATWVLPALAPLADAICFDIRREDQEHTIALLREGAVMAAITTDPVPVPGCSVTRLGAMRYRPMGARRFAERWFGQGVTAAALARAPVVIFDRQDDLQHRYLRRRTRGSLDPPIHHVPSTADYLTAVELGLGWGMLPELQSKGLVSPTGLVDLDPQGVIDVVLHWQQWKLRSPSLDRVARAVIDAAASRLLDVSG